MDLQQYVWYFGAYIAFFDNFPLKLDSFTYSRRRLLWIIFLFTVISGFWFFMISRRKILSLNIRKFVEVNILLDKNSFTNGEMKLIFARKNHHTYGFCFRRFSVFRKKKLVSCHDFSSLPFFSENQFQIPFQEEIFLGKFNVWIYENWTYTKSACHGE